MEGSQIRQRLTLSDQFFPPSNLRDLLRVRDDDDAAGDRGHRRGTVTLAAVLASEKRDLAAGARAAGASGRTLFDIIRGEDEPRDSTSAAGGGGGDGEGEISGAAAASWRSLADRLRIRRSSTDAAAPLDPIPGAGSEAAGGPGPGVAREAVGTPEAIRVSLMTLLELADGHGGGDGDGPDGDGEEAAAAAAVTEVTEVGAAGDEGEEERHVCCVCMVRGKGAAFIPCGHTFCRVCSRELLVSRGTCPLCNALILEILDIF